MQSCEIDKNIDLVDFINQEKLDKKINSKKIFCYFIRCLAKSIIELNNKFYNVKNKTDAVISGINMIYHIYFILISYTNNIKLTVFLLERSILLYSEFIIMSQDKKLIDDICFIPNITDAISFAYKKTIGPIIINKINNIKPDQYFIKDGANIMKCIFQLIYIKSNENNLSYYLDEINILLGMSIFCLFEKTDRRFHNYIFNKIIDIVNNNNNMEVSIIKIKLLIESMLYLYEHHYPKNFKIIFNEIFNHYMINKINYDNFLLELKNFKKNKLFYQSKKKIDTYYNDL